MSSRVWNGVVELITGRGSSVWKKLAKPTVVRGQTQWPKSDKDQEKVGIRFDYDGAVMYEELDARGQAVNVLYHKWQVQTNAGKIPSSWKDWRDRNGGTHAVVGTIHVKDDADKDEVKYALSKLRF